MLAQRNVPNLEPSTARKEKNREGATALPALPSTASYHQSSYSYGGVDATPARPGTSFATRQHAVPAASSRWHAHGSMGIVLLLCMCCLAPVCCFGVYAVLTLQRKLSGPSYESVSTAEAGDPASSNANPHDAGDEVARARSDEGGPEMLSQSSRCDGSDRREADTPLAPGRLASEEAGPKHARRCDEHRDDQDGLLAPLHPAPLPDDALNGEPNSEPKQGTEPAGGVETAKLLLTGPPRSGFGKAADSVLQAALDEQRERTNELLRKAMEEKERMFEAMRDRTRRDLESGTYRY